MYAAITPATTKRTFAISSARGVLWVMFTINFLNYLDRFILPSVAPKIQSEWNVSDATIGVLGTAFTLVYGIAALPLGLWADRGIRKNVVAIGVGIWSLATLLSGAAQNVGQLFVARAAVGIGEAGYYPAGTSLLIDYVPFQRRAWVMSLWNVGASLGIAVGFALGGIVADHFGWRWAFYLTVGPGLICTFLAWRMREPRRGASEAPLLQSAQEPPSHELGEGGPSLDAYTGASSKGATVPSPYIVVIRSILRIPTMRVAIAAQTLNFFVLGAAAFWFPTMLTRRFTDLSLSKAGLISGAVLVLAGIVGTLGGGWLADRLLTRLPNARLLVTAVAFLLSAPVLFLSLQVSTLSLFLPLFFLGGVFLQAYNGPLSALMQDVVTPPLRAASVALSLIIAHVLGDAFAPAFLGGLSDALGRDAAGHGLLVSAMRFTLAPVILAAGLVALLGLRHVVPDMQSMQDAWQKSQFSSAVAE